MAIDLNKLISITSSTLRAGSTALTQAGNFLTTNTIIPNNSTQSSIMFTDPDLVGKFFGLTSPEYAAAINYFLGYDGATSLVPFCWFSLYINAALAPYTRGGAVNNLTLTALQAITAGVLTVNFNGMAISTAAMDFSGASSYSDVAAIVQAALITATIAGATCVWDSTTQAFTISNGVTGSINTVTYCTDGTVSVAMLLQQSTGAVLSQGSDVLTPGENLDKIIAITTNWSTFTNIFDNDTDPYTTQLAFCEWVKNNNDYSYILWSTEANLAVIGNTSNLAYALINAGYAQLNADGSITFLVQVMPNFGTVSLSAALMGFWASIDYTQQNATINFAGKSQAGLLPTATTNAQYTALTQKGFNFYGQFNSRAATYNFTENGSIGGPFKYADNIANRNWLDDAIQTNIADLLAIVKRLPNNTSGYAIVKSTVNQVMIQANFNGVAEGGNTFTAQQTAALTAQAGTDITTDLFNSGYYIQVVPSAPAARSNRDIPVQGYVWYTNGSAVNKIAFAVTYAQ